MNRKWVLLLVLAVFSASCRKKPAPAQGEDGAKPAAGPAKVILTIGDVSRTNEDLKRFIQLQYADGLGKQEDAKLLSRLFDVFREQQLILYKAEREGTQVDDGEVAAFLDEARSRGQTPAFDREAVRASLKVQKHLLANAYHDIDVPDAEISAYYEAHLAEYQKKEEIELSQIMAGDRETLLRIRAELVREPARFAETARAESTAPEAAKGGAMGFFEKGMLPKEMEDVVFSLKVNEISPVVESPYGFHLFMVTRRRRARTQVLADVREQIRSLLLSAKLTDAYDAFLRGLQAEVPVRIRAENLFFPYTKPDPGVNDNESKNLPGADPLPNG
ncbi:MAG TPA: peptidyl-prolyl cis-trans isomerase [Candidatus Aminicenantes bacterium]|nr:peptidyl-prolyl cis-trans isomerase [Candidatus Aminicenantes bacterium]